MKSFFWNGAQERYKRKGTFRRKSNKGERQERKKKDVSLNSCKSWGREYNLLEAKPTLLERSYSRYGCRGFLVHFNYNALLLSFLLVFRHCLLITMDIKGHRIVLLNLIVCILALFWFIF